MDRTHIMSATEKVPNYVVAGYASDRPGDHLHTARELIEVARTAFSDRTSELSLTADECSAMSAQLHMARELLDLAEAQITALIGEAQAAAKGGNG
jgi:hypothetical protein